MPKKLTAEARKQALQNPFAQYLERAFVRWQSEMGSRKTLREFGLYLGLRTATLSKAMRGMVGEPEDATVSRIAAVLGSDVYDVLNRPRPDPLLDELQAKWAYLDEGRRGAIRAILLTVKRETSA